MLLTQLFLHKQFCECQIASWQQTHMWLSYWVIFLSYHMIGERTHIHLLHFSEFRDLVTTLVDPINFITRTSSVKNSERIFIFSIYVHYSVCTSLGWPNYSCQLIELVVLVNSKFTMPCAFCFSKFMIYYFMSKFQFISPRVIFRFITSQLLYPLGESWFHYWMN